MILRHLVWKYINNTHANASEEIALLYNRTVCGLCEYDFGYGQFSEEQIEFVIRVCTYII